MVANPLRGCYLECMPTRRVVATKSLRPKPNTLEQLLIARRPRKGGKARQVAFQWYYGAGELHYYVLTPAQSTPYFEKDQALNAMRTF